MQPKTFNEQDWKLFREKVPTWQENYMEKINKKIQKLLENPSKTASEKFWQIEEFVHLEDEIMQSYHNYSIFLSLFSLP